MLEEVLRPYHSQLNHSSTEALTATRDERPACKFEFIYLSHQNLKEEMFSLKGRSALGKKIVNGVVQKRVFPSSWIS